MKFAQVAAMSKPFATLSPAAIFSKTSSSSIGAPTSCRWPATTWSKPPAAASACRRAAPASRS